MRGFASGLIFAVMIGLAAQPLHALAADFSPTDFNPANFVPDGRGENLTVKIAVLGPGDELYFWWGHIALIVEDSATGRSDFFDYGIFSFDQENFFLNFARGRLIYSTGVSPSRSNIAGYVASNRDVTLYTLNLPPETRELMLANAMWDVMPENREYLYHHFRHNCATPIIRAIDMATEGQFMEKFANEPARLTLRGHVRRHTWFSPFMDWILNFLMGQDVDAPITAWDEMFLPSEVARNIADFEFADSSGRTRRLVSDTEIVFRSEGRPAVLEVPRLQWPRQLVFGLSVSALLGLLFFVQAGKAPALGQVVVGVFHCVCGLVFGVAGGLLFFMSNFTEHDYTFHNANVLFSGPLLLALVPLGIRYAAADNFLRRARPEFRLRLLWLLAVLGILASMLMRLSPRFWQDNLTDQMLMLPIALSLSLEPFGLGRMLRRVFFRRRL